MYGGFFLDNCIFTLLRCFSYSLNSGSNLACLFHSALFCCPISLQLTDLSLHLSLAASCTLWQSVHFFIALSAKSFCDCKYLSTIVRASEGMFWESMAAQFVLDNSPLFDMRGVPSRLLSLCTSVLFGMLNFSMHVLLTSFSFVALSSLFELHKVSVAVCRFFSSLSAWLVNRSIPSIFVILSMNILSVISTNFAVLKLWKLPEESRTYWTVTWVSRD